MQTPPLSSPVSRASMCRWKSLVIGPVGIEATRTAGTAADEHAVLNVPIAGLHRVFLPAGQVAAVEEGDETGTGAVSA